MASSWRALRSGESVRERRRQLEQAHERFIGEHSGHVLPGPSGRSDLTELDEVTERFAAESAMRPVVLQSWLRSRQRTINPNQAPDRRVLSPDELHELQRIHPIGLALPVVHRLLLEEAQDSGFLIAIGDAAGRLLWVDGDYQMRSEAEEMGFLPGMDWSEASVGTSAPGSAITLDHAIQVLGAEHYNRFAHEWSCTAAPVHDPISGSIIGVIDVTGGDEVAAPHILPLIEATVAAVEAELKLEAFRAQMARERGGSPRRSATPAAQPGARLVVLGRDPAILESAAGTHELAGRHAEILLALASAPAGLSGAVLAESVYGDVRSEQTLRAEIVRLRKWLTVQGIPLGLDSRPYRLSGVLRIDAQQTLDALGRGAHRLALAAYDGPVLPGSEAPVASEKRAEVDAALRESMLQCAAADPLYEYALKWAPNDEEVWQTLLQVLPPRSPKRARVVTQLGLL